MNRHTALSAALLAISTLALAQTGLFATARAETRETTTRQQAPTGRMHGTVMEVIDAAGYTYARIDTGKEKVWAAGPVTALEAGDKVAFSTRMPMANFHSKALQRDFAVLYFTNSFMTEEGLPLEAAADATPSGTGTKMQQASEPVAGIDKLEGGTTIAGVLGDRQNLAGKTLRLRGKVTKFNGGIMGRNWLHIVDSSTTGDLTVTTGETAAVGDIVIVEGTLQLDRDFGYGYAYPLIVEDAHITKE